MKVNLTTNCEQFSSDIAEVIRLYIPDCELAYDAEFTINCNLSQGEASASLKFGKEYSHQETYETFDDALKNKSKAKRAIKHCAYMVLRSHFGFDPPWGCLTGIRPSKLYRELALKEGKKQAVETFKNYYMVQSDKILLCQNIVESQSHIISSVKDTDFDLYVGIPFCKSRCVYCSFASYEVGKGGADLAAIAKYCDILIDEIKVNIENALKVGYNIRSVYIGGGTPTAILHGQLEKIIKAINSACAGYIEFTVEAGRPDTIDNDLLCMLKQNNVSRISINPQSMNADTLLAIGRNHSPEQVESCFLNARQVGFDSINMDIIIGLPGEGEKEVLHTMQKIAKLAPDNLTVHSLAVKRASRFKEIFGVSGLPKGSEAQNMLNICTQGAQEMGMNPYYMYRQKYMSGNLENIGFCTDAKQSIYNIDIMEECANILALGSGAISKWLYDGGKRLERTANPKDLNTYFNKSLEMTQRRKNMFLR